MFEVFQFLFLYFSPWCDLDLGDLYAVVQKSLKPKEKKEEKPEEVEDQDQDEDDIPPALPSRPDFEAEEDQRKFQENTDDQEGTEKTKGVGIIKSIKKHIRNISDGAGPPTKTEEEKSVDGKQRLVESLSSDNKKSKPPPPKAYLVTDIINLQPSTKMFGEPEMYESGAHDEDEPISSSNDLPDGWKEVNDAGGTYYWHVASGTTQWEKPKVNTVWK